MIKFLHRLSFFLIFFLFLQKNHCYAFFQYINRDNTPLFVDAKKGMWYLGPGAGMAIFGAQNFGGYFNISEINSLFTTSSKLYYSPYFTITAGYKPFDYNIRFEINFDYMNSLSKNTSFDSPKSLGDIYAKTVAASMQRFRIGGSMYYQLDTALQIGSKNIGFLFGVGGGVSINRAFLHSIETYASSDPNSTISNNSVSQFSPATSGDNVISKGSTMIALYFDFMTGITVDMSETVLVQLKLKYSITTKPVLNENLSGGTGKYSGSILQNQFIGAEMSILFRTS